MTTKSLLTSALGWTAMFLLGAAPALRAEACTTVLQAFFDSAAQDKTDSGYYHPVSVTFSKHIAGSPYDYDHVQYAHGYIQLQQGWINSLIGKYPVQVQSNPTFAIDPRFTLDLVLYQSGLVSFQNKISNKPVGGLPPTLFTASCAKFAPTAPNAGSALLWAVVNETVYAITLEILPKEVKIH